MSKKSLDEESLVICPVCKTSIPDDSKVCPACRSRIGKTDPSPRRDRIYCNQCGALIPSGSVACPSCGMPVPEDVLISSVVNKKIDIVDTDFDFEDRHDTSADSTSVMARIESAIPSIEEVEEEIEEQYEEPHTKAFLAAAIASLLFVGGFALVLAHPWNPDTYVQHTTEGVDTSKAGFPGTIDSLSGQDSKPGAEGEVLSPAQADFKAISGAYESFGKLSARLDKNQDLFTKVALDGTFEERSKGKSDAASLSIEVSNVIGDLQKIDGQGSVYKTDYENVLQLGSWLRNRADALLKGWTASVAVEDPHEVEAKIMAPVAGIGDGFSARTNKQLFDQHYEQWKPSEV